MAQSRSASGTKKNTSAKKKARKPIRREVGSVVCLALGLFTLIGYFVRDYWLIDWLCLYVFKGLFGWGFLVVPLCFLWAAAILGFHRGRPVAGRIVALPSSPLLFGAAVHLLVCKTDYGFDWLSIRSLYYGGINLETGGVVSGLLSIFLERAVSVYGALPVFIIALFSVICVAGKVSLRERVEDMKNRPRAEYEPMPEPVPEKTRAKKERGAPRERAQELPVPEIFAVPEPANASAQPQEEKLRRHLLPPPEESGNRHPHRGRTSAGRTDPGYAAGHPLSGTAGYGSGSRLYPPRRGKTRKEPPFDRGRPVHRKRGSGRRRAVHRERCIGRGGTLYRGNGSGGGSFAGGRFCRDRHGVRPRAPCRL